MARATEPKSKPKPQELPGMEQREVEDIVAAAERYRECRDERLRQGKLETEAKATLITVMHRHDRTFYSYRGLTVELKKGEEDVKVVAKDNDTMEAAASKRNTRAMVTDIKAAVKPPAPEPSAEESAANVEAFFDNDEANAEVAEAVAAAAIAGDDFTAVQCSECKAIEGAHSAECSQRNGGDVLNEVNAGGLKYGDVLAYARAQKIKAAASWARKWFMSGEKDGLIKAYFAESDDRREQRRASAKRSSKPDLKRARQGLAQKGR